MKHWPGNWKVNNRQLAVCIFRSTMNLQGRIALVTGASQGIGKACALLLAEAGADVAVGSRNFEKIESVAEKIKALGRRALPLRLDVSVPASVTESVAKTLEALGKIDIL